MKRVCRFVALLLLVATMSLCNSLYVPNVHAQNTPGTVVEDLTFHYYSLVSKAENNSYFIYDGADAVGPRLTDAFETTPNAQSTGTYSGYAYWSGAVLWGIELQKDVHVSGTVEVRAYISSTFDDFGFFDGAGYGMGLADIDIGGETIVQQFVTEGPQYWMQNPFTATPEAYTLTVNVDYVFKKGHYLGFFVGAGSTVQGFTFTVYFDSPDCNSGASLPIVDQTETFVFNPVWEGKTYEVVAASNSYLSNFGFDHSERQISFDPWGIRGTSGHCQVSVPKTLLGGPFKVFIDDQQITPTVTENATNSSVYFTYTHDPEIIKVVGTTATAQQLNLVMIEPSSKTLQIGATQQFSAQGYDQNNNPISGLTFTWAVTGGIGSVSPASGQTTIFTGSTAGSGSISVTATYMGETKSGSASITVTTGPSSPDVTPPTITHTPISSANDGQAVTISAVIADDVAVAEARLYYRKDEETAYASVTMAPSGNTFVGVIPASEVTVTGVQYYINATDGNNFSTHPSTNPATSPHAFTVYPENVTPTAAALGSPSDITQNSMKLAWTQNTEADFARYDIYQSTTSGTLGAKIHTIVDRSLAYYAVTGLSENTTYYFTIRVVDTAGLFVDSIQVNGKTLNSAETGSIPAWILWSVGGLVAILAGLAITILVLRQRKK